MTISAFGVDGICNADFPTGESTAALYGHNRIISVVIPINDDATANGTTEVAGWHCNSTYYPNGCWLLSAAVVPAIAVTAHDTNYATINLNVKTSAGVAVATFATQTTKITGGSGNMTALNRYALTATAANGLVAAGNIVTAAKAIANAGVALTGTDGKHQFMVQAILKVL